MKLKDLPIKVKAGPDDGLDEGEFTAYASVFGNTDSYGDVVVKGAFVDTLDEWAKSGNSIPLLFGHRFDDPDFNIGSIVKAEEDDRGLKVTARIDLDSPKGAQTYRLLKGRRISQMSFAYDVLDHEAKDGLTHLKKLKLHEVSVVPIGANQETEILAVKAAAIATLDGVKAGRSLSSKNEAALRDAVSAIEKVLDSLPSEASDQSKASDTPEVSSAEASDDERVLETSSAEASEAKAAPSSVEQLAAITNHFALTGQEGA